MVMTANACRSIKYDARKKTLEILDHSQLPTKVEFLRIRTLNDIYVAIKEEKIIGAMACALTAACGLALFLDEIETDNALFFLGQMKMAGEYILEADENEMLLERVIQRIEEKVIAVEEKKVPNLKKAALEELESIRRDFLKVEDAMSTKGAALLKGKQQILTYGSTGCLSTGGRYGTAMGSIYKMADPKALEVYVCESRPNFAGARIAAFELTENGIAPTIICDNSVSYFMAKGLIDAVVVDGCQVLENGDVVALMGTSTLAILAAHYEIPFYVFTPSVLDQKKTESILFKAESKKKMLEFCARKSLFPGKAQGKCFKYDITPKNLITEIIDEN